MSSSTLPAQYDLLHKARLELTALKYSQSSEWATITHPFHPLRGQQFKILSSKTFNNKDILSLQGPLQGTFGIPRDWTDKAELNPLQSLSEKPPILSFTHLQQLSDLISTLKSVNSKKIKIEL